MTDWIDLQNKEFDAVAKLCEQYRRITLTAVVDDDYPEVRHGYESALMTFMEALAANGRMKTFNEAYYTEEKFEARRKAQLASVPREAEPAAGRSDASGSVSDRLGRLAAEDNRWQTQSEEDQRDDAGREGPTRHGLPGKEDFIQKQVDDFIASSPGPRFVSQDWTRFIPMMQQTVLLGIVRGPDGIPKYHPVKSILRWYRRCLLLSALDGEVIDNPWDPRGGSFTGPSMPHPNLMEMKNNPPWWVPMQGEMSKFMQTMDQMPIHFWLHMMHAVEIMGVHHSDPHIRSWWTYVYTRMVEAMHVYPETALQLNSRLGDTREGWLARSDPAITK